jgi:hypothetical protein
MKKFLKKIGKFFLVLRQADKRDMRKTVLLVDGSFILPNNFALIIKGARERFKNAKLTVLTFKEKEGFIKDSFPDIEIIVPEGKIKKHKLATQLFLLLRKKFDFVVLSSLDISLVITSLIFTSCPVFLHNRWFEWYKIRKRTLADVLRGAKSVDRNLKKRTRGIKDVLKKLGRVFLILSDINREDIRCRILVVDNGYTDISHVLTAVRTTLENFINPDITILTFMSRRHYFVDMLPSVKIAVTGESNESHRLAVQMYRMRKDKFHYVVVTTLDVSPITAALLFMKGKVLLYNRWHQWWSLGFRNALEYFKGILIFLAKIPIFVYLLVTATLILLRTGLRLGLINLKSIARKNKEGRRGAI